MHLGARCVTCGAARLAEALAASLPPGCIRTGRAVKVRRDQGAFIDVLGEVFDAGGAGRMGGPGSVSIGDSSRRVANMTPQTRRYALFYAACGGWSGVGRA